ncbi:hypothetical protein H6B07_04050 [Mediterraneibacter glycyrrhizinilyticus]|nr:hypothetical protein [Mediterraneibacter glycyrrhizinilyticus]MBM6801851.1 hypothetical protein [Mediterraneibacter glycyrrhizinilyticus]
MGKEVFYDPGQTRIMWQGGPVGNGGFTKGKYTALHGKAAMFTFMNAELERKERSLLEEKLENKTDCGLFGSAAWLFRTF